MVLPFTSELLESRLCLSGDPGDFVAVIDNPYLPLFPGTTYIHRGVDENGKSIRSRFTVTTETKTIGGVTTTAIRDRRYFEGELVEDTYRYFAQDQAGDVWCFGEQIRRLEAGMITGTDGSWEAGTNGAEARIVMMAQPRAGDTYSEQSVVNLNEHARVPFASFGDTLKTDESGSSGMAGSGSRVHKFYAPGIGCVMSQSADGSQVLRLAHVMLAPEAYSDTIDNPQYPLMPGTTLIYRGVEAGIPIRLRVNVTRDARQLAGVATTVVRDRQYEDGELIEDTSSYFAQDKAGNVWFFGENARVFEDGVLVRTEDSWEAGVNGAAPTLFMRARPAVGDFHRHGNLPGIAEDETRVIGTRQSVRVPFGTFTDALIMEDSSPLEPDDVEIKIYVPGIGLVFEQAIGGDDEVMRLAYVIVDPA